MKISVVKKLLMLCVVCALAFESNAQFNYSFSDDVIPVVGVQYGLVGGGHTAMLFNRDDQEAVFIKQKAMNFTYFAGIERIRWYTPFFGFGQQVLFWNGGSKYGGALDSTEGSPTLEGSTKISYVKVPVLFWWKSYSRWHPERKLRANAFFGPYGAMAVDATEEWVETGNDQINTYKLKSNSFTGKDKDTVQFFDGHPSDGPMTKLFDWGFTLGGGIEYRISTRTVISLTVRADIGMTEVENKNFEVDSRLPGGNRYKFYRHITSKHVPYTSTTQNFDFNRAETRNNSFGIQVSVRKYFGAK